MSMCLLIIVFQQFSVSTAEETAYLEEAAYLNDCTKITMRTGQGTDYRIIAMPSLGQKITVLEKAGDWVKIRTEAGNEGWVSSRFVGYEEPYRIRFEALQKQYTEVSDKLSVIEQENNRLTRENREMAERLKTEIKDLVLRLEKINRENRILRDAAANRFIKWFLAGAGVLLIGFMIGYFVKKGRRRSYSL